MSVVVLVVTQRMWMIAGSSWYNLLNGNRGKSGSVKKAEF